MYICTYVLVITQICKYVYIYIYVSEYVYVYVHTYVTAVNIHMNGCYILYAS